VEVEDDVAMTPHPSSHLRIARPSRDLQRTERFWADGLALQVLYRTGTEAEGGHALVMLGWPEAAWHLELIDDPRGETPPSPTEEDLLVLYVGGPLDSNLISRLIDAGGQVVAARNPYWDRWGVTIEDPDGYRLVLSHRTWP
jgi:catechol 2,3-dioxygenase-like lactoylglutathione lyase family enzyme